MLGARLRQVIFNGLGSWSDRGARQEGFSFAFELKKNHQNGRCHLKFFYTRHVTVFLCRPTPDLLSSDAGSDFNAIDTGKVLGNGPSGVCRCRAVFAGVKEF
jgi:hypothetical protein